MRGGCDHRGAGTKSAGGRENRKLIDMFWQVTLCVPTQLGLGQQFALY